mgnify:CR=1 FL=1
MGDFINFLGNNLADFWTYTGFANATGGHVVMLLIGLFFIYLAIAKEFEPMLLIPIGFGILIGNIPFNMDAGLKVGIYEEGSVLNILYQGVTSGWYPPLIFLGIGAMTDFSALISNPKLMLIGAAAQFGIFGAYMIALEMGFDPMQAGAIGIIGGADGPTAIFLSSKLAPNLMGAIAVSAYSYMALVPVIQPPIMRLLTTKHERLIRMKPPRVVSHTEKVMFPIVGLLLTCFLVPSGLPLLGMLFFGNLLKESGVTRRLANTASGPLIDTITILLGLTVGASTQASEFLTLDSILIFGLGALSFIIATASGVIFVKIFNIFLKKGNKINPLIGNAGVSAVPDSARISQVIGLEYDPTNYLLMHAMGPNVAGVIGTAVAAADMGWVASFVLISLIYIYSHYCFASVTARISAMYAAFVAVAAACGVPAMLVAITFGCFANLPISLTHYGNGCGPVYFGAGYVSQGEWWRNGFIITTINVVIWLTIGMTWWKFIGLY